MTVPSNSMFFPFSCFWLFLVIFGFHPGRTGFRPVSRIFPRESKTAEPSRGRFGGRLPITGPSTLKYNGKGKTV